MLFNSFYFIFVFLPVVLILYFILNKYSNKFSKILLIISSLYFYGYFHKYYILIILSSISLNYFYSLIIVKYHKKFVLYIGVILNLIILGYYKYLDFFIENINLLLDKNLLLLKIILPLGISFFTFQQISYLIDTYNNKRGIPKIEDYMVFVSFFPQLVAGPIVLSEEILPQLKNKENKKINYKNLINGLFLFSIGLAKKVFLADTLANLAEGGFDNMEVLNFAEAWITSLAYTAQLYFDFSGYCDMAMGIALFFNIKLPLNFNSPYKSKNISEFWTRWHITLGRFLKNYLYIPLGGNRCGEKRKLKNLFIVFLASGIWHGAGWNYIIWGFLHGIFIIIDKILEKSKICMNKYLAIFITFNIINILWIFFRTSSLQKALDILKSMFNVFNINLHLTLDYENATSGFFHLSMLIKIMIFSYIIIFFFPNSLEKVKNNKFNKKVLMEITFYFILSLSFLDKISTFLYFNF